MENYKIKNNQTGEIKNHKEDLSTLFLYDTLVGRLLLRLLPLGAISKFMGYLMNLKVSKLFIKSFIKQNNLDMTDYFDRDYQNFNDFFTREIRPGKRPFSKRKDILISPCDSTLFVYKINQNSVFKIKNAYYSIDDLINNDLAKAYQGGYILIFRLWVDNYHRYSYIDTGYQAEN